MTSLIENPVLDDTAETFTTTPRYPEDQGAEVAPRAIRKVLEPSDRIFRGVARIGGAIVLTIMILVGFFLAANAVQAISSVGVVEFLTTQEWSPETGHFGIAALAVGTVLIAFVALVVAFPLSLGISLFITEIAPPGVKRMLTSALDLMAAVPSVVFGLWGLAWLQVVIVPFSKWLSDWFGWIPIFHVDGADPSNPLPTNTLYTSSTFIAGLVVAMMAIPIMASIMRESFSRAPQGEREGALALGATRWGMIRRVVLPFGRGGVIGATMLGLGRALGETIAIYLIISPIFTISFQILQNGSNSIAAHIALRYGEASDFGLSALMAAGLFLFLGTMLLNSVASTVIAFSRSGAESEG
ncbi:phosphate ABC transporter permease subunit PstC [uncultured Microbacterium sp.]|uniref:phosphate ABC transporter permease subunit PstC n=1 Tax=uncultured Microbacterium sp. TaxID=191216 RepID=UPI0035CBB475